jgi:hypothetical protein
MINLVFIFPTKKKNLVFIFQLDCNYCLSSGMVLIMDSLVIWICNAMWKTNNCWVASKKIKIVELITLGPLCSINHVFHSCLSLWITSIWIWTQFSLKFKRGINTVNLATLSKNCVALCDIFQLISTPFLRHYYK